MSGAPRGRARRAVAVAVLSVVAVAVAPFLGPVLPDASAGFVFSTLRLPRALLAALVGGTLALVGAAFQVVLHNPLATPSTVGTTAGASLGALAVIVALPGAALGGPVVAAGAFAGAAAVSLTLAGLAASRRLRTEDLLLAGVAVGVAAGAATTGLQLQADAAATLAAVRWALGSVATVGHGKALALLPAVCVAVAVVLAHGRALQALVAGPDRAHTQGVDVVRTRTAVLTAGSLAVGACVASVGPIAFVGLVVPHVVRRLTGGGPRLLVPLSGVAGAGFLALADALARVVVPGRDLPVGVLTAAIGAPVLVAVLWRR